MSINEKTYPALWLALCQLGGLQAEASIDSVHRRLGVLGRGTFQRARDVGRISTKSMQQLAEHYGPAADPVVAANSGVAQTEDGGIRRAQDLSQGAPRITPTPLLDRGAIKEMRDLPEAFRMEMWDDAIAPRAPRGSVVTFVSNASARAGDGVLVRDADGNVYPRMLRAVSESEWEAVGSDERRWKPLTVSEQEFRVVAVVVAVDARWG